MAEGTSLKMKFDTMSGSRTWTFRRAKSSPTKQQVLNLANTMIANASLFEYQPVRVTDIRTVTTSENVYDLDN